MKDLISKFWCFRVENNTTKYTIKNEIDEKQKEWINVLNKHPKLPLVCFELDTQEDYLKIEEDLINNNEVNGIINLGEPFLAAFYLHCFHTNSYGQLNNKEKFRNFITNLFRYFYDYYSLYLNNENNDVNNINNILDIIYKNHFITISPSWNLDKSFAPKEDLYNFMLKFISLYQQTPNFQNNIQIIKDKVIELSKRTKTNNEILSKFDNILKSIYLKCYENGQTNNFFDKLLEPSQRKTFNTIITQIENMGCEMDPEEIKAMIYFNKIKSIEGISNFILNISISYVSQEVFNNNRKGQTINTYCELFNSLSEKKLTNVIFECSNEKEVQEIKDFMNSKNIKDFSKLSKEEKETGQGIYYIMNKKVSHFYPQYRLNISKTPLELFNIIKFVRKQVGRINIYSDITYKFLDDSSSTYFNELLKKVVGNDKINIMMDLKDVIKEYLIKNINEFHNALLSKDNNSSKYIEIIEKYIKQSVNILEKNIVNYYKPFYLFKQSLKQDFSQIEQLTNEEGGEIDIQKRIVQIIKQNETYFEDNKPNQKIKTSSNLLPSFVEIMKEEFDYYIELFFTDQTKEMKQLIYLSYDYFLKYRNLSDMINTKRQKICFFYWFIKSNQSIFELLEKLMLYIGIEPDSLYSIYEIERKHFVPENQDNKETIQFLEFSISMDEFYRNYFWLIFNCLIKQYNYESVLKNLSNFDKIINIAQLIVYHLDINSREQILLQCYFSLISNLSKINFNKERTKQLLIKINTSFNKNPFPLQNEINEWEQINKNGIICENNKNEYMNNNIQPIQNLNNQDEDNKLELFNNFNKFIIQYLITAFKLYPNNEDFHQAIIDIILSNNDYLKQSKPFFKLILRQTIFDFENEITKENINLIINNLPLLTYLSTKIKEEKNEILEQILINIFENIIYDEINNIDKEKLKSPLYINYYSTSVKMLWGKQKYEIIKLQMIAFLKVYLFSIFKQIDSDNSPDYSDFFYVFNKDKTKLGDVLKIYLLKNVRKKDEYNYEKFKHYSYQNHQIFFVRDYSFKEKYQSYFEYLFLSECKEGNKAFEDKYTKNEQLFKLYQKEQFRINDEKEYIINELSSSDCDILIDNMFNIIFSKLNSKKYREEEIEMNDFKGWFQDILNNILKKKKENKFGIYYQRTILKISDLMKSINEDDLYQVEIILICLKMTLLFCFLKEKFIFDFTIDKKELLINLHEAFLHLSNSNIIDDNYQYLLSNKKGNWYYASIKQSDLPSYLKKNIRNGDNSIDKKENIEKFETYRKEQIESIAKSIQSKKGKFIKNIENFELINFNGYIYDDEKTLINQLAMNLLVFMSYSYNYYFEEVRIQGVKYPDIFYKIYDKISEQLRLLNLTNSKLFMNVFYVKMKEIFLKYTEQSLDSYELFLKITEIIDDFSKNKEQYISYMHNKINYEELEFRNLTLDKRIDIKKIKLEDYPYFNYFYYAKYPSVKDFTKQFNKIYHKRRKYPITNEIINNQLDIFQPISQDKMNQLIQMVITLSNDLSQIDIKNLTNSKKKTIFEQNQIDYQYIGRYDSFDSIIINNSYRNNFYKDQIVYCNGDIIEYDYNAIEKEVNTIFFNASYIEKKVIFNLLYLKNLINFYLFSLFYIYISSHQLFLFFFENTKL